MFVELMKLDKLGQPDRIEFIKLPKELFNYMVENLSGGCLVRLNSNSKTPYVFHKKAQQMVLVVNGDGFGYIGDKTHQLKKGDLVYFGKMVKHSFFTRTKMHIICYHLPTDFGGEDKILIEEDLSMKSKILEDEI